MLQLAWPWVLSALILPLFYIALLPRAAQISGVALKIPFFQKIQPAGASEDPARARGRLFWALLIWCCLVLAASRPQWIDEPFSLPVSGRDLMLALDLSASMDYRDPQAALSRYGIVKRVAGDFIERRLGDRIGLILFGSRAYLHVPLTFDRKTVGVLLHETSTTLAGPKTALGDAIAMAIKHLQQRPADSKLLILLTDGAHTTGIDPLEAAARAAQQQLKIYTIGVGTDSASALSELDENTLMTIAEKTGGRYFHARNREELEEVYQLLDQLEPALADSAQFRLTRDLFHWPLSGALILTLLLGLPAALRGWRIHRAD